jgi:hypothetical protein
MSRDPAIRLYIDFAKRALQLDERSSSAKC